jgi:hypothetical protein
LSAVDVLVLVVDRNNGVIGRQHHRRGAVLQLDAALADDHHVAQRGARDAEAHVVGLGLEHQQRGLARQHALRDRHRHDAIARGLARCRRGRRVAGGLEPRDLGLRRRARDQRLAGRLDGDGLGHAAELDRRGARRGLGAPRDRRVDDHLVTGLGLRRGGRPHPVGAVDGDRQIAAHRQGHAPRQLVGTAGLGQLDHHAGAGQAARRQRAGAGAIMDGTDQRDIEATGAAGGQRLGLGGQRLVARAGGDHAIADQQHALGLGAGGQPVERVAQVRGAERLALSQGGQLGRAEVGGPAVEHRLHFLIERGHVEGEAVAVGLAQRRDRLLERVDLRGVAERARRAGVDQHGERRHRRPRLLAGDHHAGREELARADGLGRRLAGRAAAHADHEVAIGLPAALAQRRRGPAGRIAAARHRDAGLDRDRPPTAGPAAAACTARPSASAPGCS